jgi:hypothetical protein
MTGRRQAGRREWLDGEGRQGGDRRAQEYESRPTQIGTPMSVNLTPPILEKLAFTADALESAAAPDWVRPHIEFSDPEQIVQAATRL